MWLQYKGPGEREPWVCTVDLAVPTGPCAQGEGDEDGAASSCRTPRPRESLFTAALGRPGSGGADLRRPQRPSVGRVFITGGAAGTRVSAEGCALGIAKGLRQIRERLCVLFHNRRVSV